MTKTTYRKQELGARELQISNDDNDLHLIKSYNYFLNISAVTLKASVICITAPQCHIQ